jgi:hypothetical protein
MFQLLLFGGWVDRRLFHGINYLHEENRLTVLKWNYSHRRGVCRPRVMHIIADFLVRTAMEKGTNTARTNSPWRQC